MRRFPVWDYRVKASSPWPACDFKVRGQASAAGTICVSGDHAVLVDTLSAKTYDESMPYVTGYDSDEEEDDEVSRINTSPDGSFAFIGLRKWNLTFDPATKKFKETNLSG